MQMQTESKLLLSTGNHLLNLHISGSTSNHKSQSLYAYMNVMLEYVDRSLKLPLSAISFRMYFPGCNDVCSYVKISNLFLSNCIDLCFPIPFTIIGSPTCERSWVQCDTIDWSG